MTDCSLQQQIPETIRVKLYHLTQEALDRACEICDFHSVGIFTDIRAWMPAMDAALRIFSIMQNLGIFNSGPKPVNVPIEVESELIQQYVDHNNLKLLINRNMLQNTGTHRGYDAYFAAILKMIRHLLHDKV